MARFRSCAKINLHLEVAGKRQDGYHDLRTIFQTIDLADELEIVPLEQDGEVILEVEGESVPRDQSNLAVRAAREFLGAWGRPGEGVRIGLIKRIPVGGGLGGGSSNAATVLRGMSQVFDRQPDRGWMLQTAARLGADVPFFLVGGTALGLGRGDELVALDDPPGGPLRLWLATPGFVSPTAEVFAALDVGASVREPRSPVRELLAGGPPTSLRALIGGNDLEETACRLRPELAALYTVLDSSSALRCRLSGSGSTIFALFEDASEAGEVAKALPAGTVWREVATLGRSAWRIASGFAELDGRG